MRRICNGHSERQEIDGGMMAGTLLVIDPSPTVQRVVQLVLGQGGTEWPLQVIWPARERTSPGRSMS